MTGNGQFVVAWDFNKIKRGKLDKYDIQWYSLTMFMGSVMDDAHRTLAGIPGEWCKTTSSMGLTKTLWVVYLVPPWTDRLTMEIM